MDILDFYDKVENHKELLGVGIDDSKIIVRYMPTGHSTTLPTKSIKNASWDMIEDVLTMKREPQALQHMTRVVGYYSRTSNWNKSKLGELKDRQKGNYAIGAMNGS